MVSRHSMESDTNTKKPKARSLIRSRKHNSKPENRGRPRSVIFSRLARVIFMSNLIGLVILISGSMALNQYTRELVNARIENLYSQAGLITSIMGDTATGFGQSARLDVDRAREVLGRIDLPKGWRVRLHNIDRQLLADSQRLDDQISVSSLAPLEENTSGVPRYRKAISDANTSMTDVMHNLPWRTSRRDRLRRDLPADLRTALSGEPVGGERYDENDKLIVSVSLPVRRVQQVLGVVTLESADVEDIIARERRALAPFIGLAIVAAMLSSIALTFSLVYPLRQLSRAAEIVAQSHTKRGDIPDFSKRGDEIGDLSVVLRGMTQALYSRIDDIANFAADVAHEIKNPLTSLRSASDTLRHAKNDEQREKLITIIQDDVGRMDRLISDISRASKVDASLARETAQTVDIDTILSNITEFYQQTRSGDGADVVYETGNRQTPMFIRAFETPFAQVLRNLIDNALTFSPPSGKVVLQARTEEKDGRIYVKITVEDDGPGIPPDNLETVFERFYTERPSGAQFGSHSGLGLAICRQIITAHKGNIRAENRLEGDTVKGARFVVMVPLAKAKG